jgi:hypothetical protein
MARKISAQMWKLQGGVLQAAEKRFRAVILSEAKNLGSL